MRSSVLLLSAVWLACAATGGSRGSGKVADTSQFPSQEKLDRLGKTPVPANLFALDVRPVESWELSGPFPEQIAAEPHVERENPWSALLQAAAERRAGLVVPTEAMHCVAQELGRFYLSQRGQPATGLRRFMTARCNASVAHTGFAYVNGDVSAEHSDEQIYEHWRESVAQTIRKHLAGGPRTVGIWYGRQDGYAVVMLAFGRRALRVEPFSPFLAPDGVVEIRGEVLIEGATIQGLVNRGRFAVQECEPVGEERLPSFHLRCETDPQDESAQVVLSVHPPNRLLGQEALAALVWPQGKASRVYRPASYGESWPMLSEEKLPEDFVALLNQVRREAGLAPVVLDMEQTETATELAPHFFSAVYGHTDEFDADIIVLGMLAGWGVNGIVQTGHFASTSAMRTQDLSSLLATALEHPASREALLADDVDRIAVGPMLSAEEGRESMAAIFGTYSLFSEKTHDAMARRVYEKLEAERRRRGQRPPHRLVDVAWACQRAASSVQAGEDTTDALDWLLTQSMDELQRSVAGWVAEVSDIDDLEFPEEYLRRASIGVAVSVTHYLPKDEAWGRYVVMLVVSDPETRGV